MNLSLLSEGFSEFLPKDEVYLSCISDLLENKYVVKMNSFIQHGHTTCLMHCVSVSYRSYCCARAFGLDYKSAARAGLLHDLFLYDWHKLQKNSWHGFTHPAIALKNANEHFKLNPTEQNIILRHMWPLTIVPPKHAEGFIIVWYDKLCGILEVFRRPCFR